jgi:hypothetical protein
MNDLGPISDLSVVGFVGRFSSEDWPVRLLPVYRSRTEPFGLFPPFEQSEGNLCGVKVSVLELDERIEEGDVTALPSSEQVQSDHLLWLDARGFRYMPRVEAERALDTIGLEAVAKALGAGLSKRAARVQLFRSLRARSTAVASALLSVHFQLEKDFSQVRPIRQDLALMNGTTASDVEGDMVRAIVANKPSSDVLTAIVAELRRAGREPFAQELLQGMRAVDDWAAQPTLPLTWALRFNPR